MTSAFESSRSLAPAAQPGTILWRLRQEKAPWTVYWCFLGSYWCAAQRQLELICGDIGVSRRCLWQAPAIWRKVHEIKFSVFGWETSHRCSILLVIDGKAELLIWNADSRLQHLHQ